MPTSVPSGPTGALARSRPAAPSRPLGRILGAVAALLRLERVRRELRRLDGRLLRDIGLDPVLGRQPGGGRRVALAWCAETGTCFFRDTGL